MTKRDLVRALLGAAKAMPAVERRKFAHVLRGRASRSLPLDGLPPVTLERDAPRPRRRQAVETPDQMRQLGLL